MLVAHLAAAVLTFLMLRHGEQAFWSCHERPRTGAPAVPGTARACCRHTATVAGLVSQTDVRHRCPGSARRSTGAGHRRDRRSRSCRHGGNWRAPAPRPLRHPCRSRHHLPKERIHVHSTSKSPLPPAPASSSPSRPAVGQRPCDRRAGRRGRRCTPCSRSRSRTSPPRRPPKGRAVHPGRHPLQQRQLRAGARVDDRTRSHHASLTGYG